MKAMLLCAGLGERMLPLTRALPKPALPVLGRPMAAQTLARLARHGVDTAVVNLHHLPGVLREALGDGLALGLRHLRYTWEEKLLGTGGGIRNAAAYLRGGEPFLVVNSDCLSDVDLGAALATHRHSGLAATLVLFGPRPGYSTVDVDAEGRVRSIAGRPPADPDVVAGRYLFTGVQVLEPELLERIPAGSPSDIVRDVHLQLVADRRVGAYVHRGVWWDLGSCAGYLRGCLDLLELPEDRRREVAETDDVVQFGEATVAVGAGADFHSGVELRGRVALGSRCHVGEGSTIEDSVLLPGARIGPGCTIRCSIVGPSAEVPAAVDLEQVVACEDARPEEPPPPLSRREEGLLIRDLEP
jgi:mannose-1-phosphate guanylyltransferase